MLATCAAFWELMLFGGTGIDFPGTSWSLQAEGEGLCLSALAYEDLATSLWFSLRVNEVVMLISC